MPNHLYTFFDGEETVFVAAKTWKEARNSLLKLPKNKEKPLTDISGKRVHSNCTNMTGIISREQAYRELAWWDCRCGNRSFIPLDDGKTCRCLQCGRESRLKF